MTQKERVIQYIRQHGSITPRDAVFDLNIYRLADTIFQLKKKGYVFDTVIEKGSNNYGAFTYARYSINEAETRRKIISKNSLKVFEETMLVMP